MGQASRLTHAELLEKAELFAPLDRLALARLASCVEALNVDVGDEVVRQGEAAGDLYIVVSGTFGVFVRSAEESLETRLGTLVRGDCFGEMALLSEEPRSATVRADTGGELLQLERQRFLELIRREPEVALAVAATVSRRLRKADEAIRAQDRLLARQIDQALGRLPPGRARHVLEIGLLDEVSTDSLQALFGSAAQQEVAADLVSLGAVDGWSSSVLLHLLRERLEREVGPDGLRDLAERAARRLEAAGCWDEALALRERYAPRQVFVAAVGQAHRGERRIERHRALRWVERLSDEEATEDIEVALTRAHLHRERGDVQGAARVLQRGLGNALLAGDSAGAAQLSTEVARLAASSGGPGAGGSRYGLPVTGVLQRRPGGWRALLAATVASGLVLLGVLGGGGPQGAFVLFLAAGVVLWVGELATAAVISLGLVVLWVLTGIASPAQAVSGFGSAGWLFAVAIFGMAAAVARSGLLLRVGLLLIQRAPKTLFGVAGALLVTGIILSPLLPMLIGRAALTAPLALAAADALRLRSREPAAAVLGLASWIGSGPLLFLFLNASPVCLLAWGLLPDASRLRFDWVHWLEAALPLGIFVSAASLAALGIVLRPERVSSFSREGLELQLAVLGPLSKRELAMVTTLVLTVAGWAVAPALQLETGTVAILGLLGAALSGNFDRRSLQELDWDYLIFYGVALSMGGIMVSLQLDRLVAEAVGFQMARFGGGPILFLLGVAGVTMLVRFVLLPEPAILLLSLTLIPVAPTVGVDPWVAILTMLATSFFWFIPSQTPSYLVSHSASEGRLYSHAQARRVSFAYALVTLVGLALTLPYWRLLGLL